MNNLSDNKPRTVVRDTAHWLEGKVRMQALYTFFRRTIGAYLRIRFRWYTPAYTQKSETACLVVTNHANDLDPLVLSVQLKRYMRFVSTATLLEKRPWGRFIEFLQKPIPRRKGASGAQASAMIEENLRLGFNVALFPEGMQSVNGSTGFFSPRTAELITHTGAGLITCRIEGGYMSSPVWARNKRKGRMRAVVVREYTPEELSVLSADGINELIARDIAYNAFDAQRSHTLHYSGKGLAVGLENALYVCPHCKGIGVMRSEGDTFSCTRCGFGVTLLDTGFFAGEDVPFSDVYTWDVWQQEYMRSCTDAWFAAPDEPVAGSTGLSLYRITGSGRELICESGTLTQYADRLTYAGSGSLETFKLSSLTGVSNFRSTTLLLRLGDTAYHVFSKAPWPVFCYVGLYRLLKKRAADNEVNDTERSTHTTGISQ